MAGPSFKQKEIVYVDSDSENDDHRRCACSAHGWDMLMKIHSLEEEKTMLAAQVSRLEGEIRDLIKNKRVLYEMVAISV